MAKQILQIKGMHCASCASIITKKLSALPHIHSVSVNYGNEKAKVDFDEKQISIGEMNREIEKLGYTFVSPQKQTTDNDPTKTKEAEHDSLKNKMEFMLPVTFLLFVLMMWEILAEITIWMPNLPVPMEILNMISMVLATIALFWVGKPYLLGISRFMRYGVANMDTLIGIGTSVAYIYSSLIFLIPSLVSLLRIPHYTYFDVTIVVIGFITLGKYLEAKSKMKTGEAIEKLLNLQAKTALVIRDGKETEMPVSEVVHGDLIIVKPGTKIPVDGVITEGGSFLDESMVTGEPMPVQKKIDDHVVSGTINTSGSFTFKATKVGSETLLAQIITMVEEAQGSKAPIQALVDKISSVFVPTVLVIAFITLASWLIIGSQYLGFSQALSFGLVSFVGILIIACPCALGLATPTAIIVGVGKGAKEGILIKDAATLQKLHKVNVVVVDKTGTITKGKPTLIDIQNFSNFKDVDLITILASLEKKSEHPIAHAIVNYAQEKNINLEDVSNFEGIEGKGLKGSIKN
jgi:P-type Cu+ transporter